MTDDSLAHQADGDHPVQSFDDAKAMTIGPAIRAALAYIDGLHAFAIACIRWDIAGMREAGAKVDAAAKIIAAQSFVAPADTR